MIIAGIILLVAAYLLPVLVPEVPYPVVHVLDVLGWLAIVMGIILLVLSLLGRPVGGIGPVRNGRRYWW